MQCVAASGGSSICTFKVPDHGGGGKMGGCSVASVGGSHGGAPIAAFVLGMIGLAVIVRRRK
jgi:MYXO-CTERM domain-containing protein